VVVRVQRRDAGGRVFKAASADKLLARCVMAAGEAQRENALVVSAVSFACWLTSPRVVSCPRRAMRRGVFFLGSPVVDRACVPRWGQTLGRAGRGLRQGRAAEWICRPAHRVGGRCSFIVCV